MAIPEQVASVITYGNTTGGRTYLSSITGATGATLDAQINQIILLGETLSGYNYLASLLPGSLPFKPPVQSLQLRYAHPVDFGHILSSISNNTSTVLNVIGDSTGNDSTDWVYRLLTERFAPAVPSACIRYCLWDDTSQRYGEWTTLANGLAGQRKISFATESAIGRYFVFADLLTRSSADLEVQIKLALAAWTPSSVNRICGQFAGAGSRSWYMWINTNGTINFTWSADGTTLVTATAASPAWVDGTLHSIRVRFTANNGGGGYTVVIDTSDDEVTWTNRLNSVTSAGTSSIFNASQNLTIGSAGGTTTLAGDYYDLIVRDGIGGPIVNPISIESSFPQVTDDTSVVAGSPTLYVVNGSQPGAGLNYFNTAGRTNKMVLPGSVHNTFISTAHNDFTLYPPVTTYQTAWSTLLTAIRARVPSTSIVAFTQNPKALALGSTKYYDQYHRQVNKLLPRLLQQYGVPVVDVYRSFEEVMSGGIDVSTLSIDGTHPNTAGTSIWVNEAWKHFSYYL